MANDKDFKVKNGIKPTAYHEAVGTITSGEVGWTLQNAYYDDIKLDTSNEELVPYGLWFKDDGTKLYVVGTSGDAVVEYDLSTAWNVGTATYNQEVSVFNQESSPTGVAFKSDGTKMYIVGVSTDTIYQYALSTAWDVSTAQFETGKTHSVASQLTQPMGLYITSDGSKVYTCGYSNDDAVEYTLGTDWDISTASLTNTLDLAADEATLRGVALKPDGTKFYTIGSTTDTVRQYTLSTPYDLSTAEYDNINFSVSDQEANPFGIFIKPDGTKFYVTGNSNDSVYQYTLSTTSNTLDLSTGSVFEITPPNSNAIRVNLSNPASSGSVSQGSLILQGTGTTTTADLTAIKNGSVSSKVLTFYGTNPTDIHFSPDGTKAWYHVNGNRDTYYVTLSTAWDLSTWTETGTAVTPSSSSIWGITFNDDGTKFYENIGSQIRQFNLSTAYDISSVGNSDSGADATISITGGDSTSLQFGNNGSRMYAYKQQTTNSGFYQWNLTTPYDISTATQQSFVTYQHSSTYDDYGAMTISNDGTKMFVIGSNASTTAIYQYDLSTPWEVSTRSLVVGNAGSHVATEENYARGIHLADNDRRLYLVGFQQDSVFEYTAFTEAVATIEYDSSIQFAGGTAPTAVSFGKTNVLSFTTRDGGTTYEGVLAIQDAD